MFQLLIFAVIATIQPWLTSAAITPDLGCGITKGCYPATCPISGCTNFHLSWEHNGDFMDFKLVALVQQSGVQWAAVGFSFNNQMSNSSIVLCRLDTQSAEIGHTTGYSYSALKTTSRSLQNASSSINGSYMTCLFSRIKKPVEFPDQIFALDGNSLYILNAEGLVNTDTSLPNGHLSKGSSPAPVSLMDIGQLTTDDTPTLPSIVPTGISVPVTTFNYLTTTSAATQNTVPLIFMACLHLLVTLV